MKSIANQYRDLREGRMSQHNFMRNLRMSMPQYITNVTSFKDAVRILKNKAIITEATLNENNLLDEVTSEMENGLTYADAITKVAAANNIAEDKLSTIVPEQSVGNKEYADNPNMDEIYDGPSEPTGNEELGDYYDKVSEKLEDIAKEKHDLDAAEIEQMFENEWFSGKNNKAIEKAFEEGIESSVMAERILDSYINVRDDVFDDMIKRAEEEERNKYTKNYDDENALSEDDDEEGYPDENYKDPDMLDAYGGDASEGKLREGKKKKEPKKELHPNQIHPQELRMGIKVELEHTDDLDKAKKIALDHLAENPFYYTALKLAGVDSPSAPKAKTPVEKKTRKKKEAVELVDKANAMQKVKLKEVRLNISGEPNAVVKQVEEFIKNADNPILDVLESKEGFELQQTQDPNEALLRYGYWKELPKEAVDVFENEFNVEVDRDNDEDTGTITMYRLTPKSPMSEEYSSLIPALEKLVRETIAEYYDGRDNLVNIVDEEQLSPEEKETLDDLLAVNEGFGDLLNKIKDKAKKGLITAAVLGALLSSSNYSQAQEQQIKQIAGIEMQQQKGGDINKMSNQEAYEYVFNLIKKNPDGALKQLQQFKGTSQEDKNDANMLTTFANSVKSNKPIEDKDYMGKRFKMASNVVKTLTGTTQQTAKYKEFY